MAADVEPEDLLRALLGLVRRRRELDPAGLPAAPGQDLRLDHDRPSERLGGLARLGRRARQPALAERKAVAREERLRLVLVEAHGATSSDGSGVMAAALDGDVALELEDLRLLPAGRSISRRGVLL